MKTFIVAPKHIDKLSLANEIIALNDDLNICKSFTSETSDGLIGEYMFCLDIDDIILSFRNNVLLFLDYRDTGITGITLDDFESSDIIIINTEHFNSIPDIQFIDNEYLIVWLDSKMQLSDEDKKKCMVESKYLQERIDAFNIPTMYFIDEPYEEIAKIVIEYLEGDNEKRLELVQENS